MSIMLSKQRKIKVDSVFFIYYFFYKGIIHTEFATFLSIILIY